MTQTADNPPSSAPHPQRRGWIAALFALLLIAILGLAWWLWQQWGGDQDDAAALQAALLKNQSLRADLSGIKPADKPICRAGETLKEISAGPGAGVSAGPKGSADLESSASSAQPPVAPAPPPPISGTAAKPLGLAALAERLELATALVVVPGNANSLSTGSGFFITPQLLATNQHVVEGAINGRVYITSKSLKAVRRGTVLGASGTSQTGSADFALVRIDDGVAPGMLDMSPEVSKLTAVVAAGYPAIVTRNDPNFRRLIEGNDSRAAPDLSVVRGEIQSLQNSRQGVAQLVHTAPISGGNSGGPLIDICGRVIGVNTFIAVDQQQSARVSYALSARALSDFLASNGAAIRKDARSCNS
ncbi:MAG: serine protease [Pseudomonadota bacterium]